MGDAPDGLWDALVVQANAAGFDVIRDRKGSANGYCEFLGKTIGIRAHVSDLQAVKTLVHELAHALLHSDEHPDRDIAEVEVESVAYVVCDALGLDAGDYSFSYVARWSGGSLALVRVAAERVVGCAKGILEGLEVSTSNGKVMEEEAD